MLSLRQAVLFAATFGVNAAIAAPQSTSTGPIVPMPTFLPGGYFPLPEGSTGSLKIDRDQAVKFLSGFGFKVPALQGLPETIEFRGEEATCKNPITFPEALGIEGSVCIPLGQ